MTRPWFASAIAAALMLCALFAEPAEARREWQAFGGGGDATTQVECPAGEVMVGVQGRAGAWVNQLRILCAPLNGESSAGSWHGYGGFFGGREGGSNGRSICPADTVMTGLNFELTEDKGKVAQIYVACTGIDSETVSGGIFNINQPDVEGCGKALGIIPRGCQPGEGVRSQSCPQEQFVGLTIRSGRDVNAIGAICDRRDPPRAAPPPPPPVAAAPPPPPKPIHHTGEGAGRPVGSYLGAPFSVNATPGDPFTLILHEDEGPGAMWGELKFADSHLNGTLIGKLRAGGMMFDFTYEQPDAGISGSGTMALFSGGKVVSGKVTTNQDPPQTITWVGHR